jgi:DNA-binding NarL/FixJ family response regulator
MAIQLLTRSTDAPSARSASSIKILIVDDDRMIGECAAKNLRNVEGFSMVTVTQCPVDAVALAHDQQPDVVIVDSQFAEIDGATAGRQIREAAPHAALVMFAATVDYFTVSGAVSAGFAGLVSKQSGRPEDLISTTRAAAQGISHFTHDAMSVLNEGTPRTHAAQNTLTARELQILEMIADSKATGEIATDLFLSQHTVRNHVRHILRKLHARTKLEAIVRATTLGIITLPD